MFAIRRKKATTKEMTTNEFQHQLALLTDAAGEAGIHPTVISRSLESAATRVRMRHATTASIF